ncbi:serine/threonine-protein kinase [Tundrisphaera lichenicola]|uniref:serine/threonine-protein kinase n=1 Tax=Tundrisphaera lichenicola TaxID=2029860 RepID=UPI003EBB664D
MRGPDGGESPAETEASDQTLANWVAELADWLQADGQLDVEAYAREFPERAEQLRPLLPALASMIRIKDGTGSFQERAGPPNSGADLDPSVLGNFKILRVLGRGGMGVVYEAIEIPLHRRVALKVLPPAMALDPQRLQRFQVETQAVASLNHPNIVPIYSVGQDRGTPYFAMLLIDGQTLAEAIRDLRVLRGLTVERAVEMGETTQCLAEGWPTPAPAGAGPREGRDSSMDPASSSPHDARSATPSPRMSSYPRRVAELGRQAAEALEHVHDLGILHRDIKPGNLLVDARGHLWITDFGMARLQGESDLTQTGDLIGTLKYMSPEQVQGRRELVDRRSDLYSLGATLYELLALKPAFFGEDRQEMLGKIAQAAPRSLRAIDPSIPADLETIVLKAMAKDPTHRYESARAMADDLRRFLADEPIRARPQGRLDRLRAWCVRPARIREAGVALLTLGLLTSGIGLIWYVGYLAGIVRPKRPGDFVQDLLVAFLVFDAPPLWCGLKTLDGKRSGLWLGWLTSLNFLVWLLIGVWGWQVFDYGGMFEDKASESPFLLMLVLLVIHTIVRISLGLAADRVMVRNGH